jgi:hypothetical protein
MREAHWLAKQLAVHLIDRNSRFASTPLAALHPFEQRALQFHQMKSGNNLLSLYRIDSGIRVKKKL